VRSALGVVLQGHRSVGELDRQIALLRFLSDDSCPDTLRLAGSYTFELSTFEE